MTISNEILAKQAAYAAKPFAVYWSTSHFSGEFRFDTLDESFEYVQQVWRQVQKNVREHAYQASYLWRSYLETPEGRVQLRYVLLAEDVSSY